MSNQVCPICMDDIVECKNCTTTDCGHTFHSSCIFANLRHRIECPMCRAELVDSPANEDSGEEDGVEFDDDDDDEEEDDDEDEDEEAAGEMESGRTIIAGANMSIKSVTRRIASMGYTMEDMVLFYIRPYCRSGLEFDDDLSDILEGKIAPDFRDERTFAQVVAGTQPHAIEA